MNKELYQRWDITRSKLDAAYNALVFESRESESSKCFTDYRDYMSHNEFEVALDCLDEATNGFTPSGEARELLALAAVSMDLNQRAVMFRQKIA